MFIFSFILTPDVFMKALVLMLQAKICRKQNSLRACEKDVTMYHELLILQRIHSWVQLQADDTWTTFKMCYGLLGINRGIFSL